MSEDQGNGLVVSTEEGVFYIPQEQLTEFKLTDDAAAEVRESMEGDEVAGFRMPKQAVQPVSFGFTGRFEPTILRGYQDAAVIVM